VCPHATGLVGCSVGLRLPFLEAIEDELDARGNTDLIEDAEEVVANDLLLSRGWRLQTVILACVAITAALGVAAIEGLRIRPTLGAAIEFLCLGSLVATAIGLGSLRTEDAPPPSERARFRDLARDGAHQAKP
jgi:hypothetical protein